MLPNTEINVLAHKTWSLYVDTMCGSMRFRCYALANGGGERFVHALIGIYTQRLELPCIRLLMPGVSTKYGFSPF